MYVADHSQKTTQRQRQRATNSVAAAPQIVPRVKVGRVRLVGLSTRLVELSESPVTQIITRRAPNCTLSQPVVADNTYGNLLPRMEARVRVVPHDYVQTATLALVLIAARAPVLPLAHLPTRTLLPHIIRVVETTGALTVFL